MITPKTSLIIVVFIVAVVLSAGIALAHDSGENWPTSGWQKSTPEQQGMDSETLARIFDIVNERNINVHSIHVARNGFQVLNAYFYPYQEGNVHDLASVTKSITSILIGIAVDRGFISSVRIPVLELYPRSEIAHVDENKRKLTIKSLLTMTSGYECSYQGEEQQLREMRRSRDWVHYILNMPVIYEPESRFAYCSVNFHLLAGILFQTTGLLPEEFARKHLFTPLGIKDYIWAASPDGINFGWGDLHLHPADMAKIGYLFLNNGRWEDKQIVSSLWVEQSTERHVRLSDEEYYGYGWWIRPEPAGGIYEALGRAGQRIVVWPDKNIVVTFTGGGFEPGDIGEIIVQAVRSDNSLPRNDRAYGMLCGRVEDATEPPPSKPLKNLPKIARIINGREYMCGNNPVGLKRISLFFPSREEGRIKIVLESSTMEIPFGMDGVYRISPTGEFGFPRASIGEWQNESRLVLSLYQVSRMDLDEVTLTFEDEGVDIEMHGTTVRGELVADSAPGGGTR